MTKIDILPQDAMFIFDRLQSVGLRPTRQRIHLAAYLFLGANKHIIAEKLHDEMDASGNDMSRATIYNCLHKFVAADMLREIHTGDGAVIYDTNLEEHHHFKDAETGELTDFDLSSVELSKLPDIPEGYEVDGIDLTIRLKKSAAYPPESSPQSKASE